MNALVFEGIENDIDPARWTVRVSSQGQLVGYIMPMAIIPGGARAMLDGML